MYVISNITRHRIWIGSEEPVFQRAIAIVDRAHISPVALDIMKVCESRQPTRTNKLYGRSMDNIWYTQITVTGIDLGSKPFFFCFHAKYDNKKLHKKTNRTNASCVNDRSKDDLLLWHTRTLACFILFFVIENQVEIEWSNHNGMNRQKHEWITRTEPASIKNQFSIRLFMILVWSFFLFLFLDLSNAIHIRGLDNTS